MPGTLFTWVHPYTWVEHLPGRFDLHGGLNTVRIHTTLDTENYFQVQIFKPYSFMYWRRLHRERERERERERDGSIITWSNKNYMTCFTQCFCSDIESCLFQVGLTPLHLAAESGHKELVGLLVASYKASVDALTLVRVCSLITAI